MQIEDIVAKFSTGIFVWYNFKENAAILYLYSINKDKEIESFLKNKGNLFQPINFNFQLFTFGLRANVG